MFRNVNITSLALCLLTRSAIVTTSLIQASQPQRSSAMRTFDGLRFQVVQFGDLDMSTGAGDQTLYARIRTAAKRVCVEADSRLEVRQAQSLQHAGST